MIENYKLRIGIFIATLVATIIYLLPNFVTLPKNWIFPTDKLNYGLDIQGGANLIYGVDVKGVLAEKTKRMGRALEDEFKEKSIPFESIKTTEGNRSLIISFSDPSAKSKIEALLQKNHGTVLQELTSSDRSIEVQYYQSQVEQYRSQIIKQAIEVIRNRVDQFGVAEPIIQAQGSDHIQVQLPGLKDPTRAKELINRAARLDFQIVSEKIPVEKLNQMIQAVEKKGNYRLAKVGQSGKDSKTGIEQLNYAQYVKRVNDDLAPQLPKDTAIAFEKAPEAANIEAGRVPYLLQTDTDLSGDLLDDAYVGYGQYGEPEVDFRFGTEGRRKFAQLTGANVQRRMAIVLDKVVQSAPVIQGRIDSDSARITLNDRDAGKARQDAAFIATALRAGALPASLQQLEEQNVGPSLGADSIERGKVAGLVGFTLVVMFMLLYYRSFGVAAAVALGLNVFGLLAILSALHATLTLPGISGIVLTMGMAVDANIIIYERIKEEMAKGSGMNASIRDGFRHGFTAIWDSNLTTAIAGAVLIYFGSGPVRGFGVTLIAGIITTVYTTTFATRVILDLMIKGLKVKRLSI